MSWWSSVLVKEWEGMGLGRARHEEDGLSSGGGIVQASGRAPCAQLRCALSRDISSLRNGAASNERDMRVSALRASIADAG